VFGERYVIQTPADKYRVSVCSSSFPVRGNEHVLEAMRSVWKGGPSVLVGRVLKSTGVHEREGGVAGAKVVLEQSGEENRKEVTTDLDGIYRIPSLDPGSYRISVAKPGFVPDETYNGSWSGRVFLNKETNRAEPESDEFRGTVLIGRAACSVWDMSLWPAGTIEGTVRRKRDGAPAEDIVVQAFPFDRKTGVRPPDPLRAAKSQANGHYSLTGLPRGDYIIAVNGELGRDTSPYAPVFHNNDDPRLPVSLPESGTLHRIDLAIGEPRASGIMRVRVVNANGQPQAAARIVLRNERGEERWSSRELTAATGEMAAPVYAGERYIVSAFQNTPPAVGSARVLVPTGHGARVEIVLMPDR